MKKLISLLTAGAMLLALTACGSGQAASSAASESAQSFGTAADSVPTAPQTPSVTEAPQAERTVSAEDAAPDSAAEPTGGKILIAVFSRSGNTESVAEMIQTYTGGDLFTITPAVPYPEDYDTLADQAKEEQNAQVRPAVADTVENWDDYDTVFVGYPIWWSGAPMVVLTFLESYDWNGKTLIPFCTSGGSGFGNSLDSIAASAPGAEILEGFHVLGNQSGSAEPDVHQWLSDLGFSPAA